MQKAFTLIEVIVSVAIFSMAITIASGIFVATIQAQRASLANQELLDQTSYLIEYMSRAIRMAQKDMSGACLTNAGSKNNYETNASSNRIRFVSYNALCQEFFLDITDATIKQRKSTNNTALNFADPLPLTSDNLQVTSFKLGSSATWDQDDNDQPRVSMLLEIQGTGGKPEARPAIRIQTSISQRNIDIRR